jgi:hypothetical protein
VHRVHENAVALRERLRDERDRARELNEQVRALLRDGDARVPDVKRAVLGGHELVAEGEHGGDPVLRDEAQRARGVEPADEEPRHDLAHAPPRDLVDEGAGVRGAAAGRRARGSDGRLLQ